MHQVMTPLPLFLLSFARSWPILFPRLGQLSFTWKFKGSEKREMQMNIIGIEKKRWWQGTKVHLAQASPQVQLVIQFWSVLNEVLTASNSRWVPPKKPSDCHLFWGYFLKKSFFNNGHVRTLKRSTLCWMNEFFFWSSNWSVMREQSSIILTHDWPPKDDHDLERKHWWHWVPDDLLSRFLFWIFQIHKRVNL